MTRPRTITDEEILDTARQVFLEKGASATTSEIARRAGISEGTIFKRFPTKHDLFLAAIGVKEREGWGTVLEQQAGEGTVQGNLTGLANAMIDFFRDVVPRVMLMCQQGMEHPHKGFFNGPRSPARRNFGALINYLKEEMDLGRLDTQTDPELIARIIGGSCWNFAFHESMGNEVFAPLTRQEFAEQLVQTLWRGLAPAEQGGQ